MNVLLMLLYVGGTFALVLGVLHFTFPTRFGLVAALAVDGPPPPQYRLLFYRYDMKRSDLRGVIYVMNHCVSYSILVVGVFDCFAARWIGTLPGTVGAGHGVRCVPPNIVFCDIRDCKLSRDSRRVHLRGHGGQLLNCRDDMQNG